MQDYIFIMWSFHGKGGAKAARAVLTRCDLRHAARQEMDTEVEEFIPGEGADIIPGIGEVEPVEGGDIVRWNRGSGGSVKLRQDDPRAQKLIEELRRAGVEPFCRVTRVYSKRERDQPDWLWFAGYTTMVCLDQKIQEWDTTGACPTCGSGSEPVPPLVVSLSRMPKSGFTPSHPFGHIVVSSAVAEAIRGAGLTGCEFHAVRTPSRAVVDRRYEWMKVRALWPRLSERVGLITEESCTGCCRTGFGATEAVPPLYSGRVPQGACDFNHTWEQWGCWRWHDGRSPHGGSPNLIISQRARLTLLDAGVRLKVIPLVTGG